MRQRASQLSPAWYLAFVLFVLFAAAPARAQDALSLSEGQVGTLYSAQIKSEGGLAPLSWRVSGGQLPPGLAVSSDGKIDGTPTAAAKQPFTFELTVSDSSEPPQIAVQRFSIMIGAPPLRIVGSASAPEAVPLKIIAPSKSVSTDEDRPPRLEPRKLIAEPISYSLPRQPHFVVPLGASSAATISLPLRVTSGLADSEKPATKSMDSLDPATFIRVFEDPKTGKRRSLYEPVQPLPRKALQLEADYESSIIIVPEPNQMGEDLALNKLYITAKLSSGSSSKDVVVNGYSEVGKDKATMAAQSGAAFQSAANVQAMVLNMAYTVGDIIHTVYVDPSKATTGLITFTDWKTSHKDIDFADDYSKKITKSIADTVIAKNLSNSDLQVLQARLRLYQPEIQAISDFLVQPENLEIVEKLGVKIFWIDRDSMVQIAQQYKQNIQVAVDPKSTDQSKLEALEVLLERTKLVYEDFGDIRRGIMATMQEKYGNSDDKRPDDFWQAEYEKALQVFAQTQREGAIEELKKLLASGSISLTENQAKDGDRLTVTVESLPSNSSSGGIPVVFEIAIKKFGAKIQLSPSFLFVRRLGVTDAEATPPTGSSTAPLNRVNFAPSPGMTFGIAYFHRGDSSWAKFVRGLGPGAGINVTFMNFNDPSFNLATTQFVNTNGTNVQVGAGLIGSLFDDKIQFSYGWDLNVEKRRTYFGVGFGFIEIGKELAKYIPK